MAAPVDAARTTTSVSTAATSTNINTGTPANGDLALVLGRFAGDASTVTFTGYNVIDTGSVIPDSFDASDDWTWAWWRVCDGTEGATDAMSWVNSVKGCFTYYRITGHDAPGRPPVSQSQTISVGTGANLAPNACTPSYGSADYLWITWAGLDGETQAFGTPLNYTNLTTTNSGTGGAVATNCRMASASRQLTAASEASATLQNAAPQSGVTAIMIAVPAPSVVDRGRAEPVRVYNPAQMQAILRNRGR